MSTTRTSLSAAESSPVDAQDLEAKSTMITPEGFGFSSTTKRVLQQAGRGSGYFKALDTDTVTSVMDGITDGQVDAALVFEEGTDKLLGIFTESDYVQVSQSVVKCCCDVNVSFLPTSHKITFVLTFKFAYERFSSRPPVPKWPKQRKKPQAF